AKRVARPCGGVLPVQQHDVEVFGVRQFTQLVELLLRVDCFVKSRHLRHELITVARNPFQRDAEHLVHLAVGFGGFEETDAVVVGISHQASESILPELSLHLAAEASGAEREARYFHPGAPERHIIGGRLSLCQEWKASGNRQCSRCETGLQEFTTSEVGHASSTKPQCAQCYQSRTWKCCSLYLKMGPGTPNQRSS